MKLLLGILGAILLSGVTPGASAQVQLPSAANGRGESSSQDGVVTYTADFFLRYQVTTALDMVNRVPGFTVDDGGDMRGFGGAAGNVLINDRRPSTKQDAPSAILGRISADLVERIELIRVRVRDIDLYGRTEVVNVVLREDNPATYRWEAYVRQNMDHGPTGSGSVSLSDRWGEIEYNVGFDLYYSRVGDPGMISTYDGDGVLMEIRDDDQLQKGPDVYGYFNSSTWLGDTFVQLNTKAGINRRDALTVSTSYPQVGMEPPSVEYIAALRRNKRLELGLDAERVLSQDLLGKAIVLYSLLDQNPSASQRDVDPAGVETRFRLQRDDTSNTETIARLEFDWAGLTGHAVQADLELALNVLDNVQVFTEDTGAGPVVVDVPGGNVRVEEDRWNFRLQDTWSLGLFDLDYGLGLERSTISQSGDANLERSFSFLKPRAILTHTPRRGVQTRLRFEREVSQLDFNDFVSVVVFEDDDVALGNPDLHPDSTWKGEISHERRFGDVGVVKLTAFHHWIRDVLDLLPLTPEFEAPGNIGDGRRWGAILETTAPLGWTGLSGAQLNFKARLQDSTVVDPVTGVDRVLSGRGGYTGDVVFLGENRRAFAVDFRQDLEAARVSWGLGWVKRAQRPRFKANEYDVFSEGPSVTGFIETTRWWGLNISLEGQNLLNSTQNRDRTIYIGERSLSPVLRRELRDGTNGTRIILTVSGTF